MGDGTGGTGCGIGACKAFRGAAGRGGQHIAKAGDKKAGKDQEVYKRQCITAAQDGKSGQDIRRIS